MSFWQHPKNVVESCLTIIELVCMVQEEGPEVLDQGVGPNKEEKGYSFTRGVCTQLVSLCLDVFIFSRSSFNRNSAVQE